MIQFLFLLFSNIGFAYYGLDLNTFYFSDSFNNGTTNAANKMIWSAALLLDTSKSKRLYVGWNIVSASATDSGSTTTTFSSTDMGPKILWVPSKNGNLTVEASYNLIVKGAYSSGGAATASQWSGSSIYASLGYLPEISESLYAGVKLNYYSVAYSKEIVSTTITDVSYSRRWIFPSICLQWRD